MSETLSASRSESPDQLPTAEQLLSSMYAELEARDPEDGPGIGRADAAGDRAGARGVVATGGQRRPRVGEPSAFLRRGSGRDAPDPFGKGTAAAIRDAPVTAPRNVVEDSRRPPDRA